MTSSSFKSVGEIIRSDNYLTMYKDYQSRAKRLQGIRHSWSRMFNVYFKIGKIAVVKLG